jgi:hypothetical protein
LPCSYFRQKVGGIREGENILKKQEKKRIVTFGFGRTRPNPDAIPQAPRALAFHFIARMRVVAHLLFFFSTAVDLVIF